MWCVVKVTDGKDRALQMIDQVVGDSVLQECFMPQYEIMKKFRGERKCCTEVLLPGYLFLITKKV